MSQVWCFQLSEHTRQHGREYPLSGALRLSGHAPAKITKNRSSFPRGETLLKLFYGTSTRNGRCPFRIGEPYRLVFLSSWKMVGRPLIFNPKPRHRAGLWVG